MSYNNGFNIRGWTDAINSLGACTPIFETVPGVGDAELTPTLGVRGRPLRATLGDYLGSSAEDSLNISSSSLTVALINWKCWGCSVDKEANTPYSWLLLHPWNSGLLFCHSSMHTRRKHNQQMIEMVWDLPYSEELMYPHRDRESIKAHYWR